MAPLEECDLLSLDAAPAAVVAEATKAAPEVVAAPSVTTDADTAADADLFDDDWDGFQKALPERSIEEFYIGEVADDRAAQDDAWAAGPVEVGDDALWGAAGAAAALDALMGPPAEAPAAAGAAGGPPAGEGGAAGAAGSGAVTVEEGEPLELDILGVQGAVGAFSMAFSDAEAEKSTISVYYKGEKNVVGWYADMKAVDIREAVMCACDAIVDGGFVLREVEFTSDDELSAEAKEGGRAFRFEDFDQLESGQSYVIEPAEEREDLKNITGDRWRRMKVKIDPLMHVEAQKAIDRMRRGSNLLKHTHYGFPHLRQFQLSDDRKRLIWYSGNKQKDNSVVQLDEVTEIRLGQTTKVFNAYRLPMLEHLSFSLVYGPKGAKTLDLTCKDEFEFDHWMTGLKACFYHCKGRHISKEELLGHSKRFKKAIEKSNCGIKLTKLPEVKEKGHVGLEDCIEIAAHTPAELEAKLAKLRERLKGLSHQVARLDHHAEAEMEVEAGGRRYQVDLSLLTGQGPSYASVFVQDEDAQDEEMEIRRMHELVELTTQALQQVQTTLAPLLLKRAPQASEKAKRKETATCKQVDQLLWKAEVDLENVEDMYSRHVDNQKDTATQFSVSIAEFNRQVAAKFEEIKGWQWGWQAL